MSFGVFFSGISTWLSSILYSVRLEFKDYFFCSSLDYFLLEKKIKGHPPKYSKENVLRSSPWFHALLALAAV